jgi:drug/metabolite transporter (DMT)-like permease
MFDSMRPITIGAMQALTRQQTILLVVLTLLWGFNWPVMKIGVTDYPPLTFRALSMWIGAPLLGLGLVALKIPLKVPREHWRALFWLAVTNMFVWNSLMVITVKALSSGRAAILGYSMPIFSAVFGALFFGNRLLPRAWAGVAAAALGVLLLLWHELTHLSGRPVGVVLALIAAATWAVGTQQMRRTKIPVSTLALVFWMTVLCTGVLTILSVVFEFSQWKMPSAPAWGSILYNGVLIFVLAQTSWFYLARSLPPVASSISVMMIPILGVFSGAWWLNEALHWQDWAAMLLMVLAIAAVLWPARAPAPAASS